MKKILFGSLVALSLIGFTGCNDGGSSTSEATKSAKCGEGKCGGDAKKAESKCGGEEKATKCGGDK
ncbi:MAG: hypothetical protein K0U38_08355 [Epsilonproteobacteria bacterium]|nr:hypothetical protein [Campylobacterota bacterium]